MQDLANQAGAAVATLTAGQWREVEAHARRDGLGDAQMAGLAIGCPVHGNGSMDWQGDGDTAEVYCHRCASDRLAAAWRLGTEHGAAGLPAWDVFDGELRPAAGSADLMTAVGEHGPTTEVNEFWRHTLCGYYRQAYDIAAHNLIARAEAVGAEHGAAGWRFYGGDPNGSARLMADLGASGAPLARRMAILDAYSAASDRADARRIRLAREAGR